MRILIAEYAFAIGMGGTWEMEGRAMLSVLAASFQRCGHDVIYPTPGPRIPYGKPAFLKATRDFGDMLASPNAEAGLVIAPDDMAADFVDILEKGTANLGSSAPVARLCADKLECTRALVQAGLPVADLVARPEPVGKGCRLYVIKPRSGCGSEGVRIASAPAAGDGYIATRYIEGIHLSTSFIVGDRFLPLTVNRQLIEIDEGGFSYHGSQVPYRSPRAAEIWDVAKRAAWALGLRGYAGIDMVVGDLPRVVDVNARPTTSIIGIARVMREEIGELITAARFGSLPERVQVVGEVTFRKEELA